MQVNGESNLSLLELRRYQSHFLRVVDWVGTKTDRKSGSRYTRRWTGKNATNYDCVGPIILKQEGVLEKGVFRMFGKRWSGLSTPSICDLFRSSVASNFGFYGQGTCYQKPSAGYRIICLYCCTMVITRDRAFTFVLSDGGPSHIVEGKPPYSWRKTNISRIAGSRYLKKENLTYCSNVVFVAKRGFLMSFNRCWSTCFAVVPLPLSEDFRLFDLYSAANVSEDSFSQPWYNLEFVVCQNVVYVGPVRATIVFPKIVCRRWFFCSAMDKILSAVSGAHWSVVSTMFPSCD